MTSLRFYLTVDSGSPDEPSPRRFASLQAAVDAFEQYELQWQRFTWITEETPAGGSVTHMKDGVLLPSAPAAQPSSIAS